MSFVSIPRAGEFGFWPDLEPHEIPPNAWSAVENVRVNDGWIGKIAGHTAIYDPPTISPYKLLYVPFLTEHIWVYAGLNHIYATDGSSHNKITRRLPEPIAALTATLAGSGAGNVDNGVHLYKVTFYDGTGETELGPSATVTVADKSVDGQVSLTAIPTDPNSQATGRKIYRTLAGGSTYKLLTTIADNSTTTYTDNTADSGLGATAPTTNGAGDTTYSATAAKGWNGGVASGIVILNNGIDRPQQWVPSLAFNRATDLANWPAGYLAKTIRPFREFLVALNITANGTSYPYMVKWSHPAEPGAVPVSWDHTDVSKLAGQYDLGKTSGFLIDCFTLRDMNVIYKQDSVIGMQYIGYPDIFKFTGLFGSFGVLSTNCVVEFKPGFHVVLTADNDLIVHDLNTHQSIADGRCKKWLSDNIDTDNFETCFLAHNIPFNEVWVCFPEPGQTLPTKALLWNYRENTFGVRDLPGTPDIGIGVARQSSVDTWDAGANTTWDAGDDIPWDYQSDKTLQRRLVIAFPDASPKLFLADETETFNGTAFTSYAQRTGLAVEPIKTDESISQNFESLKFWRGIRPHIKTSAGGSIDVRLGSQQFLYDGITWIASQSYSPESAFKLDYEMSGRLVSVQFSTSDGTTWELTGYDLDIEHLSMY